MRFVPFNGTDQRADIKAQRASDGNGMTDRGPRRVLAMDEELAKSSQMSLALSDGISDIQRAAEAAKQAAKAAILLCPEKDQSQRAQHGDEHQDDYSPSAREQDLDWEVQMDDAAVVAQDKPRHHQSAKMQFQTPKLLKQPSQRASAKHSPGNRQADRRPEPSAAMEHPKHSTGIQQVGDQSITPKPDPPSQSRPGCYFQHQLAGGECCASEPEAIEASITNSAQAKGDVKAPKRGPWGPRPPASVQEQTDSGNHATQREGGAGYTDRRKKAEPPRSVTDVNASRLVSDRPVAKNGEVRDRGRPRSEQSQRQDKEVSREQGSKSRGQRGRKSSRALNDAGSSEDRAVDRDRGEERGKHQRQPSGDASPVPRNKQGDSRQGASTSRKSGRNSGGRNERVERRPVRGRGGQGPRGDIEMADDVPENRQENMNQVTDWQMQPEKGEGRRGGGQDGRARGRSQHRKVDHDRGDGAESAGRTDGHRGSGGSVRGRDRATLRQNGERSGESSDSQRKRSPKKPPAVPVPSTNGGGRPGDTVEDSQASASNLTAKLVKEVAQLALNEGDKDMHGKFGGRHAGELEGSFPSTGPQALSELSYQGLGVASISNELKVCTTLVSRPFACVLLLLQSSEAQLHNIAPLFVSCVRFFLQNPRQVSFFAYTCSCQVLFIIIGQVHSLPVL